MTLTSLVLLGNFAGQGGAVGVNSNNGLSASGVTALSNSADKNGGAFAFIASQDDMSMLNVIL